MFTAKYLPKTNDQVKRLSYTLTAMLSCCVTEQQQDWDAYASTLAYILSSQVHRSTNSRRFDLVLSQMILDFTLEPTVSYGKCLPLVNNRPDFQLYYGTQWIALVFS